MPRATVVTRWVVRLAGLAQIGLGLTFWSGHAKSLIPIHMLIGMLVVLGLWFLVVFASRTGLRPGLIVLAFLWGLALPVFGIAHIGLFPGRWHWLVQLAHLLLGIWALRLAEGLADHVLRQSGRATTIGDLLAIPPRRRDVRTTRSDSPSTNGMVNHRKPAVSPES